MNKQIQKLYDQADKFASQNRVQNIAAPGNNYFELFHEKFAELIVRECAKFLDENSGYDECNNAWHPEPEDLLQHFGVEE